MAENLYFSRDTKLYAAFKDKDGAYKVAYELPILDGFGFSQANNTSEITLAEMESSTGVSRRGRRLFNDSLAPAEWNFSTYVRPFVDGSSNTHAVEEVLWAQMAGADEYSTPDFISEKFSNGKVTTSDATDLNISFAQSNRATLQPMDLYFVMETSSTDPLIYKLEDAAVNEATINFEVDGIAMIEWSGFAKDIKDITADVTVASSEPVSPTDGDVFLDSANDLLFHIAEAGTFIEATDDGIDSTTNFIRNRITSMTLLPADTSTFPGDGSSGDGSLYNITLTGGSITITNNLEYLTPETIGVVNLPIENVTGARTITGTVNCYAVYNDTSNGGTSTDLFNDMKATAALEKVVNEFALVINVGGTSPNTPRLKLNMPKCHLEIPAHTIEDVISFETNFHALGTDISSTNEIDLTYDT